MVVKVKISMPDAVSVGAVPPAHLVIDAGQDSVALPPLVTIKVKEPDVPVAGGLLKINVWFPDNV